MADKQTKQDEKATQADLEVKQEQAEDVKGGSRGASHELGNRPHVPTQTTKK